MTESASVRERIRQAAGNRCGYCLMSAQFVYAPMEIDHIIPQVHGGTDDEDNLWLACPRCNNYKSDQFQASDPFTGEIVTLFNPRKQIWDEHFKWSGDQTVIIGQTACGRATIETLKLNADVNTAFRRLLVSAGWHPPKDAE